MENGTIDQEIKKGKKVYSQLGYTKLQTAELTKELNTLLADYSVHYQNLRNFHWNVKGPDFFDIHEQFELQYEAAKLTVDIIAERIRVFGLRPLSTLKEFLAHSDIKESHKELTSDQMVESIISDYRILLEQLFKVVEIAIENGDSGTEDMIKGFIKEVEKNHWMLTAFSQK